MQCSAVQCSTIKKLQICKSTIDTFPIIRNSSRAKQPLSVSRESNWIITLTSGFFQIKIENICLFKLIKKNTETSLKNGFSQMFSCCPKNLSCPKCGGAAAPLATPGLYAYERAYQQTIDFAWQSCWRARATTVQKRKRENKK